MKKVLFLVPYPFGVAPSQRFRVELFYRVLDEENIDYEYSSFLEKQDWTILYKSSNKFQKVLAVCKGYIKRLKLLSKVNQFDFIFIHREATPLGPPIFEWIIAKVFKKKIIYDFDDAIWLPNTSAENKIASFFKWHSKVKWISKWSYKLSCGNQFLKAYAEQFNSNVNLIPTVVDTIYQHNNIKKHTYKAIPIIGWTGSHSTLPYIDLILPALKELEKKYDFEFRVIANKNPVLPLKRVSFIEWEKETEIEDLITFDIGVMPLEEDKWSEGKCGFKAIQYMSLGIPPIVSPVGVNKKIVDHNINGYVVKTQEDWYNALEVFLKNFQLRNQVGIKARHKIEAAYSVKFIRTDFINLFD